MKIEIEINEKRSFFSKISDAIGIFGRVRNLFDDLVDKYESEEKVNTIAYDDVVSYIRQSSVQERRIDKCLLVRKNSPGKVTIVQTFVDSDGQIVVMNNGRAWGRKLTAVSIDEELASLFGSKEHILIK